MDNNKDQQSKDGNIEELDRVNLNKIREKIRKEFPPRPKVFKDKRRSKKQEIFDLDSD